jgi:AcrR family transcriptional regulator
VIENFEKLTPEKRRVVLNAAFSCFGKTGYKKTSMSDIAGQAGVSKASLFHYFHTKRDLYMYLYRYSCNEILAEVTAGPEDFFACIRLGSQIKMRVMEKHPGMYDFLLSMVTEADEGLLKELTEKSEDEINRGVALIFINVDWNRFKPGIDKRTAINLVRWITDGYLRANAAQKSREKMIAEIDGYMKILKSAVYKEEYR